jgi:hypothetical protein
MSALAAGIAVLLIPGSAMAATTASYSATIKGVEYSATPTVGKFVGRARGDLPGVWEVVVEHEPLGSDDVQIEGGTFAIYSDLTVTGTFADGSIIPRPVPTWCADELFDIRGELEPDGGGTGSFDVVLTHFRARIGSSSCVTIGATIAGTVTVELASAATG